MNPAQFQRQPISEGVFYKSVHVDGGNELTVINLKPSFRAKPKTYFYEIHGTDKTKTINKVECVENNIYLITFLVKEGETYFIKIIAEYPSLPNQEFYLWYKNNSEIDEEESVDDEEDENIEKEEEEETEMSDVSDDEVENNNKENYKNDENNKTKNVLDIMY